MIDFDDEPAGTVVWVRRDWGPILTSWCWELGIQVFPDLRRRGIGREATRALIAYLFSTTNVNRVQAVTDAANHNAQTMLVAAGLRREGLVRGAQWRHGAWHDQLLFGVLRDDSTKASGLDAAPPTSNVP